MCFLPAGLTCCLTLPQLGTSCLLSTSLGWSNKIETFQDIIWESKITPGELICQSLRSTQPVRGPCSSVCAEPIQPSAASPGHRGCPARSGGAFSLTKLSCCTHHRAWEAPRPPFLIVSSLPPVRNPKGLVPAGLTTSKLDCARKAIYFPSSCSWLQ